MNPQFVLESIATRLKFERIMQDFSQTKLAEVSGISQQVISKIEKAKPTNLSTLLKLAEALGLEWDRLAVPVSKGRLMQVQSVDEELTKEAIEELGDYNDPTPNSQSHAYGFRFHRHIDPDINWSE